MTLSAQALREILKGIDVRDIRVGPSNRWEGQFEILVHDPQRPEPAEGAALPYTRLQITGPFPPLAIEH